MTRATTLFEKKQVVVVSVVESPTHSLVRRAAVGAVAASKNVQERKKKTQVDRRGSTVEKCDLQSFPSRWPLVAFGPRRERRSTDLGDMKDDDTQPRPPTSGTPP